MAGKNVFLGAVLLALSWSHLMANNALASAQILGLVATAEPVPLTCKDGVCRAEFTAVCLQQHRSAPVPGTAYEASAKTRLTLTVMLPGGGQRVVDIGRRVSITALRNFSAIEISLPLSTLIELGSDVASLSVGALASVIPVPRAGDKNPLSAAEIGDYTGPLRALTRNVFERDGANVSAMRVLNRIINRLPGGPEDDRGQFETAWGQLVDGDGKPANAPGAGVLAKIGAECRLESKLGMLLNMKSCLANRHDVLSSETTKKVWKALKPSG